MFPWTVLALVFVDEVLAVVAVGVWGLDAGSTMGGDAPGWWLGILAPLALILCWWAFASPKAPLGSPATRLTVKVIAFGLASLGLWVAGHHTWAVALLVFSVAINALAQLPVVQRELARVSVRA